MALPPLDFRLTLGYQVTAWYEHFLCHGPGDLEAESWQIDDELANFICWLYRLHPVGHPEAGRRLARRAVLSRPKGRAKSELAGGIVCGEALGPVRFSHWAEEGETTSWGYHFMEGEPVGQPVRSPFIRCLATEEGQSGNTYDNVYTMLTQGRASEAYGLREGKEVGLTRTFLPQGGEIRPSTSGNASKDGGLETCAIADETHLYIENKLRGMYRTVSRNTGKRKIAEPLIVDTTTAWAPGERSIAEQAADQYAGGDPEETLFKHGVLYDHREGTEPPRFNDDRSLIKAMRGAYGPAADWMDFKRIVQIIRDAEDPETEAYRYYLNLARKTAKQWLAPKEIRDILTDAELTPGEGIGLGFDGSETDDHTALVACNEAGLLVPIGIWTPRGDDLQWHAEVDAAVRWAFENFRVVRFYADPPYWHEELGRWAQDLSDPSRKGTLPVMEFWTNVDSKMGVACGALRTAIRHGGAEINPVPMRTEEQFWDSSGKPVAGDGGTSLMAWHFENARTRKVRVKLEDKAEEAHIVQKERPGSPLKIDSVPSSALARAARDHGVKFGEFKKPTHRSAAWQ